MSEERVAVTWDQALARLNVVAENDDDGQINSYVHTFIQGGPMLIGADWLLSDVEEEASRYGIEESGEAATAMSHGLVIPRPSDPVFLETKSTVAV